MRAVSIIVTLPEATNDILALIKAATHGVGKTWREQGAIPWRYSKVGVITTDLVPLAESPRALAGRLDRERSGPLMAALDACNARWGRGSVVPAWADVQSHDGGPWEPCMPRYFFHVHEAGVQSIANGDFDRIGTNLVDIAAAQRAAFLLLPAVAQDEPQLDRARRDLRVCVRDESGAIVYGARLIILAGSSDLDACVTDGASAERPLAILDGSVVSRHR